MKQLFALLVALGAAAILASGAGARTFFLASGSAYAPANFPSPGYQFLASPNPFTVPACAADPCATPGAFIDANSAAEVSSLMSYAGGSLNLGNIYEGYPADNTFPTYYANNSDPAYVITCGGGCGAGSPVTVHIPNGATASCGPDHHLITINQQQGLEYDIYEFNNGAPGTSTNGSCAVVSGGGSIYAFSVGVCSPTAFTGNTNGCNNGGVAAEVPAQAVEFDPREVTTNGVINHVLYVAVGCGNASYVYPALNSDGLCGSSGPKYGQRIWLDLSDTAIAALGNPAWATTILKQMHHYGYMVIDNNGGVAGLDFANIGPTSFTLGGGTDPWPTFWLAATGSATSNFVAVPTTGISQSNIHILGVCANTASC